MLALQFLAAGSYDTGSAEVVCCGVLRCVAVVQTKVIRVERYRMHKRTHKHARTNTCKHAQHYATSNFTS